MNYAKAFGRRLKSIREGNNLTQEQVAERSRGDAKYLSALENGRSSPTLDTIMSLAKALDVPAMDLLLVDGEDSDPKSLRRKIQSALDACDEEKLRRVYRLIRDVLEPQENSETAAAHDKDLVHTVDAIQLRNLAKEKDPAAVQLGRKGGRVTAKRGRKYYKELQAKRKNRKGGRPPKSKDTR